MTLATNAYPLIIQPVSVAHYDVVFEDANIPYAQHGQQIALRPNAALPANLAV